MVFPGWLLFFLVALFSTPSLAQEAGGSGGVPDISTSGNKKKAPPAPLGVFGSDIVAVGKFSFAISGTFTGLAGSRIGTKIVSPPYIVSTRRGFSTRESWFGLSPRASSRQSNRSPSVMGSRRTLGLW